MGKRNPNGYGCVTKLKGNRSRPWCVKVTVYDETGSARQKPVGYAETEEKANIKAVKNMIKVFQATKQQILQIYSETEYEQAVKELEEEETK